MNEHMDNERLKTILNRIGKRIFVQYYELFHNKALSHKMKIDSMQAKDSSGANICISYANQIIEAGRQLDALKLIVASRADQPTRDKAKYILGNSKI